ncbi:hypothetical protein OHV48_06105 [Acinetobacter baumannii]|nr:hypothetical protein [Acinetobacter baumannii]
MKPEQFIREQGLEKAREVVEGAPAFPVFGYCTLTGNYIFKRSNATAYYHNETNSWSEDYAIELILLDDLKRLVESLEIIETVGYDRDGAEEIYEFSKDCEVIHYAGLEIKVARLAQAIRDHESIYGGGDEVN